ncbi:MAG: hypothetical protein R3C26_12290 [Calditrichia bacterium]
MRFAAVVSLVSENPSGSLASVRKILASIFSTGNPVNLPDSVTMRAAVMTVVNSFFLR